jgi:hypothetical protein
VCILITRSSGSAFGFSAYLNGQFVSSGQGLSGADTVNATLTFPSGAATNGSNVLTVVLDNHGMICICLLWSDSYSDYRS